MNVHSPEPTAAPASTRDLLMRFAAPVAALALVLSLQASTGHSAAPDVLDPRAAGLREAGRLALSAGQVDAATDDFEAALAIDPGSRVLLIDLAEAARADGLQGKAIHYYRVLLARNADDTDALAGEGAAMAEKGALAKAEANLARLRGLCGDGCPATQQLAAVVARADSKPAPRTALVNAEALAPKPSVSNN